MAEHKNVKSFAAAIAKRAKDVDSINRDAVEKAAFQAKKILEAETARAVGPDFAMSNFGNKGNRGKVKLKAGYNIRGKKNVTALLSPRGAIGAWYLVDKGSKGHIMIPGGIGKVQGKRTKANRQAAKREKLDALLSGDYSSNFQDGIKPFRTPWGPRYKIKHPGTKGKQVWDKAKQAAIPVARMTIRNRYRAYMNSK